MTFESRLDHWSRGWRGPLLAALVAMIAGLPGLIFLPPMDRDESRFAEASAQMLETGDFVRIRYQDQPRNKKPVGIHWMQTASVETLSSAEARGIWAYRIPSLLGAMLAAAAFRELAKNPNKDAIAGMIFKPEFQGALLANGFTLDGEEIAAA